MPASDAMPKNSAPSDGHRIDVAAAEVGHGEHARAGMGMFLVSARGDRMHYLVTPRCSMMRLEQFARGLALRKALRLCVLPAQVATSPFGAGDPDALESSEHMEELQMLVKRLHREASCFGLRIWERPRNQQQSKYDLHHCFFRLRN